MNPTVLLSLIGLTEAQQDKLKHAFPNVELHVYPGATVDDVPQDVQKRIEIALGSSPLVHSAESLPALKWIQIQSAGVNSLVNKPVWQRQDVILTKGSGIHAVPLSERILAMMLAFRARLPYMWQIRRWPEDKQGAFRDPTLRGGTVGIVGYGAIGGELGRMCQALGMRVLAMNRSGERRPITNYAEPGCGDAEMLIPENVYAQNQLLDMLPECDHVVVLTPITDDTRHLFDARTFATMKDTAYFYNFGRGEVADEDALIEALRSGVIAGAGLDVFRQEPLPQDSPLWDMPNVIITPHTGGMSSNYNDRLLDLFSVNLERYLSGEPMVNVVDRHAGY